MMRRVMHPALILLLGLLASSEAIAQTGAGTGYYVRGQAGYAWPSLGDVNSEIRSEGTDLRQVSTLLDWEELSGGGRYSAELGYAFTPVFSLGVELGYQKSARDHSADILFNTGTAIVSGRVEQKVEASLLSVMLTPTFRVPSNPGLHFGAQIGMGRGSFDRRETDDVGASDGTFVVATIIEEFEETAFTGGLFAGYDFPVSPQVGFSMRAGYLVSNFSSMEGPYSANGYTELGPFSDSGSAPLTDSGGNALEVSFNGLNLSAGIVFRFASGH